MMNNKNTVLNRREVTGRHDFRVKKMRINLENLEITRYEKTQARAKILTDAKSTTNRPTCIMHHLSTSSTGLILENRQATKEKPSQCKMKETDYYVL